MCRGGLRYLGRGVCLVTPGYGIKRIALTFGETKIERWEMTRYVDS